MSDSLKEKLKLWFEPPVSDASPMDLAQENMKLQRLIAKSASQNKDLAFGYKTLMDAAALNVLLSHIYESDMAIHEGQDQYINVLQRDIPMLQDIAKAVTSYSIKNSNRTDESLESAAGILMSYSKKTETFQQKFLDTPENEEPFNLRRFTDQIEGLVNRTNNYNELTSGVLSFIGQEISSGFTATDNEYGEEFVRSWFEVTEGPKTVEELELCCMAYLVSQGAFNIDEEGKGFDDKEYLSIEDGENVVDATVKLFLHLRESRNDLPQKFLTDRFNTDWMAVQELAQEGYSLSPQRLYGLAKHYADHNESKLINSAELSAKLKYLCDNVALHTASIMIVPGDFSQDQYEEEYKNSAQRVLEELLDISFPMPQEEDVLESLEALGTKNRKSQRAFERITEILSQSPDNLETTIIHHYQESEAIRKMRQSQFKAKWIPEGGDGPKRAFIKDLAVNESDKLKAVGFSDDDITAMSETGKLPENCGWNIEHIIDREHGGTNHTHNFILMPEDLNSENDELKTLQKTLNPDADKGSWMISRVPKKLPDGTYPKVFIPESASQNNHEPVAEQEIPEITLH